VSATAVFLLVSGDVAEFFGGNFAVRTHDGSASIDNWTPRDALTVLVFFDLGLDSLGVIGLWGLERVEESLELSLYHFIEFVY
jgi:hypothetical protein